MIKKKIKILAMCIAFMPALLTGCRENRMSLQMQSGMEETMQTLSTAQEETGRGRETRASRETIFVDISGAVRNPGVYELIQDARVCDAVKAAGGLQKEADQDVLNQARRLEDGEKVYVCTRQEAIELSLQPDSSAESKNSTHDNIVNLNTADAAMLMTLPGIGESKAADIIAYRTEHGGFHAIEDIKNISGIKDAVFNKIKDKIAV